MKALKRQIRAPLPVSPLPSSPPLIASPCSGKDKKKTEKEQGRDSEKRDKMLEDIRKVLLCLRSSSLLLVTSGQARKNVASEKEAVPLVIERQPAAPHAWYHM